MADNWLEKKQAALSSGPTVIRKVNPSLEQLLRRISTADAPLPSAHSPQHPAEVVKPRSLTWVADAPTAFTTPTEAQALALQMVKDAQLEAITRSAKILFPGMQFESSEGDPATIQVLSQVKYEALGKAILAMQLKAAELGLDSYEAKDGVLMIYKQ